MNMSFRPLTERFLATEMPEGATTSDAVFDRSTLGENSSERTFTEATDIAVTSHVARENGLTQAMYQHPQLWVGVVIAFAVTLLVAATWTLYGAALKLAKQDVE